MADHKAPTQVTIAATTERSLLHGLVDRTWKFAAVLAVGITAFVLIRQNMESRSRAQESESWDRLREEVTFGVGFAAPVGTGPAGVLGALADDLEGTVAGPWARALEASRHMEDASFDQAVQVLRDLEARYPTHLLARETFRFGEDGPYQTLEDHLAARMDAVQRWEEAHDDLFHNPPLPDDAPHVRLNTSRGAIVIGLYSDRAPLHTENFVQLCRDGGFDGTLFHRINPNLNIIQGGDPLTANPDSDPALWGTGGPETTIPAEVGDLRHFAYVLAAAKKAGDEESSASQFYITTGTAHYFDEEYTVYGTVLSGQSVVDEIEAGELAANQAERPKDPVRIESTEIL